MAVRSGVPWPGVQPRSTHIASTDRSARSAATLSMSNMTCPLCQDFLTPG